MISSTPNYIRLVVTTKILRTLTLCYTLQDGTIKDLKFGASALYTGKRNGEYDDAENTIILRLILLSAFTTLNLSAGYDWENFRSWQMFQILPIS